MFSKKTKFEYPQNEPLNITFSSKFIHDKVSLVLSTSEVDISPSVVTTRFSMFCPNLLKITLGSVPGVRLRIIYQILIVAYVNIKNKWRGESDVLLEVWM